MGRMTYGIWRDQFFDDADDDGCEQISRLCRFLGVACDGPDLTRGTARLVSCLCGYEILGPNGTLPEDQPFLRMQKYDPFKARHARFCIFIRTETFGWARIVSDEVAFTDLADLHGCHTIRSLIICRSRLDLITERVRRDVIDGIESDLHYDYGQEVKVVYVCEQKAMFVQVIDTERDGELHAVKEGALVGLRCRGAAVEAKVLSVDKGVLRVEVEKRLSGKPMPKRLDVPLADLWYVVESRPPQGERRGPPTGEPKRRNLLWEGARPIVAKRKPPAGSKPKPRGLLR